MDKAPVAELVDALDSKSSFYGSAGSTPAGGTTFFALPLRYLSEELLHYRAERYLSAMFSALPLRTRIRACEPGMLDYVPQKRAPLFLFATCA